MSQKGKVDVCPITKEAWEARATAKRGDCGGQSVYHCLPDRQGGKWERCVEISRIKEGFCPIFSKEGFIEWKPCNVSVPACPNVSYVSNEVYKYSHCFGNSSLHEQTDTDHSKAEGAPVGAIIGIVGGLLILAALFIYFRRAQKDPNTQNEEDGLQVGLLSGEGSDEIVKEQNLNNGTALLVREDVRSIIVVGKFGNSVSSTSRCISNRFHEVMNWNSLECRHTDIPSSVDENTIIYIYGWFGLWNDDLCSVNKAKEACKSLIQILNETRNVKFILGMRSDLNKKYHQILDKEVDDQITSFVHYEIYLDSGGDAHKDDEYINFFNDRITNPCKKSECACKRLEYEMLCKGDDKVLGMPLKLRIIEKYHELIPSYLHHLDMSKVIIDHFNALKKNKERRRVFEWIVYLCLKGKYKPGSFDKKLVKNLSFEIDEASFRLDDDDDDDDNHVSKLGDYTRMRNSDKQKHVPSQNAQYVFWHPFIYICAFHFLFHEDPKLIMKYCNVDAIFQLVRPKDCEISYFEVAADDSFVDLFNERIHELGLEKEYAHHPLVQMGPETEEPGTIRKEINYSMVLMGMDVHAEIMGDEM